jgi:hypothetical protein
MPINLNLWSLMLGRWLDPSGAVQGSASPVQSRTGTGELAGAEKWRNRPPPYNLARLSSHLRRDIGLDCERV